MQLSEQITNLQKTVYHLAVEKNNLDKKARHLDEEISTEKRVLAENEHRRLSEVIHEIEKELLTLSVNLESNSIAIQKLEMEKKNLINKYSAVWSDSTNLVSDTLSSLQNSLGETELRLQQIETEGRTITMNLMALEEQQKNNENSDVSETIHDQNVVDEYTYIPTVEADGTIDYTTVEPDKIYLANRRTILTEEYPSYLPPVHIRRNNQYDIPSYKVSDNEYLLRESDVMRRDEKGNLHNPQIYRVSLDVYAALVNYHLEFDRAAFQTVAKRNEEARAQALASGLTEYQAIRESSIPLLPGKIDVYAIPHTYSNRRPHIENKPSRVAFASAKSRRMNVEPFYFIQDMNKTHGKEITRGEIFAMHRECINAVNQKILDMEFQKADYESAWTKGRETSYGDSNLDDSLLPEYGIRIKRQNGDIISRQEIEDVKNAIDQVHSLYGNLSNTARSYGLKVSHAGSMNMHASKSVGIFSSYHNAIGISFAQGVSVASLTAVHEYSHFLDHLSGKEHNSWHASDIPGTLENRIAVEFRSYMRDAKGQYWNRTCECFARAMEEYAHIEQLRSEQVIDAHSLHSLKTIDDLIYKPAYVKYLDFHTEIEPLITTLLLQYKERFITEHQTSVIQEQTTDVLIGDKVQKEDVIQKKYSGSFTQLELFEPTMDYNAQQHEFFSQISEYLQEGISPRKNEFILPNAPDILRYSGIKDRKIVITTSILNQARKMHNLSSENILHALMALSDPVCVFDTNKLTSEAKQNSVLILTDIIVNNSKPVAIALELGKEDNIHRVHTIRSIHGRNSISRNGVPIFTEWTKQGLLKYVDDIKISGWQTRKQVQSLLFFTEPDIHTLMLDPGIVNTLSGDFVKTKTGYVSEYIREHPGMSLTEGDPALTRDHIRSAKAALQTYTEPVLRGDKSGLWKTFRDFKKHGVFDIQGASIATDEQGKITPSGWNQLYQALNIYRDKRFETFRVLFITNDGDIIDQLAISSHLPNCVNVSVINGELRDQVIAYAIETNTKIVVSHNHPSGNIKASVQDESLTQHLESTLVDSEGRSLLLGHIILDHNNFGLYTDNNWSSVLSNTQEVDPLLKTRLPEFTQLSLNHPTVLKSIAEKINESDRWNSADWVPVLFTNGDTRISGIRYYSKDWFKNKRSENIIHEFQTVGARTGAIWAFPILSRELAHDRALTEAVVAHMKNGCFMDLYIAGETADTILGELGSGFYEGLSREEILEQTSVESTFELDKRNGIDAEAAEAAASAEHGIYSRKSGNGEELFLTENSPNLHVLINEISKADIGTPNKRIVITDNTPFIFTELGLPNKRIEIYVDKIARSIMLPITERHGHSNSISKENVLEVFSQIANPRAVFRSKNSISLVAVYDVLDAKNEPVMISLKNEKKTIEANLVTSIYGKPTQDIEYWLDSGRLLYVNDLEQKNAFMLPSRQLRMSNINAFPNQNIRSKSGIVNSEFLQEVESGYDIKGGIEMGQKVTDSLVYGQLDNKELESIQKETSMEGLEVKDGMAHEDEKKKPYYQLNAEMLLDSIKTEKAPFLAKNVETPTVTLMPQAVRSAATGRTFRGMNQILAQISLKEMGSKDTEIITYKQAKTFESGIRKGSQGLHLTSYDAEGKKQTAYKYYPYSATYDRDNLPKIPEHIKKPNTVIFANEADPKKYLGKYLAATSLGAKFVTTPETMESFRKRIVEDLEKSFSENRHSKIFEIGNKASEICRETMSEIGTRDHTMSRINDTRRNSSMNTAEPYNPVTGEKFIGENARKAAYLMERRKSTDSRFLEITDLLKAGLSLKEDAKEVLTVSADGKTRFFYNAIDIKGMPPMNNVQDRAGKELVTGQKQKDLDMSM